MHSSVALDEVTGLSERSLVQRTLANQAFWVTVAVALICLATAWEQPQTFATLSNFFNITRNFAAIGIMALGMTAVIITGGIDLSVGSVMALTAIGAARVLEAGYPWWAGVFTGLVLGLLAGGVTGTWPACRSCADRTARCTGSSSTIMTVSAVPGAGSGAVGAIGPATSSAKAARIAARPSRSRCGSRGTSLPASSSSAARALTRGNPRVPARPAMR
jgi:hypothetical protein